jgi:hypothetical protein
MSLPGMDAPTKGRRKYGPTARSSDMGSGPDLDTTSARRRIHEAVVTFPEDIDDWEEDYFASSRVSSGRYSPSRRQLILEWTNGRQPYVYDAIPPAVWTGFRSAGSQGQFVNHTLNTFPYRPYDG